MKNISKGANVCSPFVTIDFFHFLIGLAVAISSPSSADKTHGSVETQRQPNDLGNERKEIQEKGRWKQLQDHEKWQPCPYQ